MKLFCKIMVMSTIAIGGAQAATDDGGTMDIWQLNSMYRFNEAYQRSLKSPVDDRSDQYAKAVTMLNLPTKTQSNINTARDIFTALTAADSNDEIGICAQYFLGRIAQIHSLDGADFAKARDIFRKLYRSHPEHTLAQLGYIQLVLLELYDKQSQDSLAARLKRLEAEQPVLSDREIWKNYQLVLAQAYLMGRISKQKALEHYLLADQVGMIRWRGRSDFYATIIDLARNLGHRDIAIAYCKKFLDGYPRDQRSYIVSQFLIELQKPAMNTASLTTP
jgi:hypothetical protein